MKKLIVAVAMFAIALVGTVPGQEIPKTSIHVYPSIGEVGIRDVYVEWEGGHHMNITVTNYTKVSEIGFFTGEGEEQEIYDDSPDYSHIKKFSDREKWAKFAQGLLDQFKVIGKDMWTETNSFEYLGRSFVLSDGMDLSTLVFKGLRGFYTVPSREWLGGIPKVGEKILIGHGRSSETEYQFRVHLVAGEYTYSPAVGDRLREDDEADRERLAEFKKAIQGKSQGQ